jgi:hypothetical protein
MMNLEYKSARILVGIAPFAAAFIPAYLLFRNAQEHLGFPWWAALITAIAAESIGASAITVYYKAVQHNEYYTADKNQVKAARAIWAYGIYLIAVLTVNALLEAGIMAIFANAFLTLLGLSGALLLSVHFQIGEVKERYNKKKTTETIPKAKKAVPKPLKYEVNNWNHGNSTDELTEIFPNVTERTLYNWQARARE